MGKWTEGPWERDKENPLRIVGPLRDHPQAKRLPLWKA